MTCEAEEICNAHVLGQAEETWEAQEIRKVEKINEAEENLRRVVPPVKLKETCTYLKTRSCSLQNPPPARFKSLPFAS